MHNVLNWTGLQWLIDTTPEGFYDGFYGVPTCYAHGSDLNIYINLSLAPTLTLMLILPSFQNAVRVKS